MSFKSKKISAILKQRNLSWYWLYQHTDIGKTTIYDIRNDTNKHVEFETMEKIADALDVSLDEFRSKEEVE
ncbi:MULTISPECIES: helix-turn-helix domain-containing protein [Leuconostoc]|uniref:helix-turn-helix domain-containing protein n=1 Tax=Leuconostoc TaxID=1243 RepID=UPI001CC3B3D3|nr:MULTISPECIES: helix-turn-helix transcriptional regulator [Leuconostoc]MBZ5985992.1 helix-turn-helix transcriptional regulator [Leuconostoc gelidum subsp. gelidum]MCC2745050.1 helix-turn-helix transcriptional regulator [Leuconostoc lactis]MCC2755588.1 helix-turn-helix transcriptional regulator [Leuconostoc lactis]MCT3115391.1 XRE family transcriptional regulator [Leuconostoc lactis]